MSYSPADYLDDLDFRISLRDAFERGVVFGGTRIA